MIERGHQRHQAVVDPGCSQLSPSQGHRVDEPSDGADRVAPAQVLYDKPGGLQLLPQRWLRVAAVVPNRPIKGAREPLVRRY